MLVHITLRSSIGKQNSAKIQLNSNAYCIQSDFGQEAGSPAALDLPERKQRFTSLRKDCGCHELAHNVPTRLFLTETACLQHKQVYGFLHDEKTAAHAFGQLVSSVAACMSKPGLSETTHAQTRWMASTPPRPGPASSMAKQTQTTRGSSLLLGLEHFDYRATGPILCRIGVLVVATSRVCTSKPRIKRFPSEGPPTFPMAQTRSTSDHLVNPTGLCKSATTPTRSTLCIVMHRGALWCIVMHHCWMLPLTSIKYVAYNGHL